MNPAEQGWRQQDDPGLPVFFRPLWTRAEGEAVAFGFQTRPEHFNGRDMVHGGIMALFADHALGMTVRRAVEAAPAATIQLDIRYIGVTRPGSFVEVRAEVLRRTRSIVFVRGLVTAGDTLVASAEGVWKLLAGPPR
ncbi:PaaI family thioesterase [Roseomonas haemaphysalidis]|uniref:PaaI family thioesterase n=1 Tax=Roseomonas haemaphysalidis TaxID=2768162 RepID=A0ABS3KUZ1_9PROT|nr:PaaI family thioesterase [Roseomonas haemaphysalidis]MBO1081296.1 PaaI family thioesterase [Roseomonas haemaphysalidis]